MKYEKLAESILALLNGMGYKYKMYKGFNGKRTSNPYEARYFYVEDPNMMFIIDETSNTLSVHKSDMKFSKFKPVHKSIREIVKRYFINLEIRDYNKSFSPKDFSPVQMKKDQQVELINESRNQLMVESVEKYGNIVEIVESNDVVTLTLNGELSTKLPYKKDETLPHICEDILKYGSINKEKIIHMYKLHEALSRIERAVKLGSATSKQTKFFNEHKDKF